MTVSIRNPLIRTTRVSPGIVAGATSARRRFVGQPAKRPAPTPQRGPATARGRASVRTGSAAPTITTAAQPYVGTQAAKAARASARRRPTYRYALTTIDAIFADAPQSLEVERANARRDHRAALYALLCGTILLVMASVGAAIVLEQLIQLITKELG